MVMINEVTKKRLEEIWDNFNSTDKKVYDIKGNAYDDIDKSRLSSIEEIKEIFKLFLEGNTNIYEFKTNLDSYNKRNNYWGFTAAKGQMFFNLITRSSESEIESFSKMLQRLIKEPADIEDACSKMEELFNYVSKYQARATDKRKSGKLGILHPGVFPAEHE